jgi:hypothetical protein
MVPRPDKDSAIQFALMLKAGLPPNDAILYFADGSEAPSELAGACQEWMKSAHVKRATLTLMGKPWQEMNLDEQCAHALNNAYAGMAYFLYSTNYSSLGTTDKSKHDTARQALEARAAGTAGKGDALSMFMDDLRSGRVKLNKPAPLIPRGES